MVLVLLDGRKGRRVPLFAQEDIHHQSGSPNSQISPTRPLGLAGEFSRPLLRLPVIPRNLSRV